MIKRFELCDFRPIREHLLAEKEAKKNRSKAEKDQEKEEKAAQKAKYGVAIVDGHKQPIANYLVEPVRFVLWCILQTKIKNQKKKNQNQNQKRKFLKF